MFAQRLLAAMHNLPGFRVSDNFLVPVPCAINDSLQVHPLASLAVKVIASLAFYVRLSLTLTSCFEAETFVEFESVLHMSIVVRVPARKMFRMAVRSCLGGDKRSGLAGGASFKDAIRSHTFVTSAFILRPSKLAATDFHSKGGEIQNDVWELIWGRQNWCIISPEEALT